MSNIFQPLTRLCGGLLPIIVGSGPIAGTITSNQHLNLDEFGNVHCVSGGVITHYGAGLPFDGDGRLVLDDAFTLSKAYVDQGIPFGPNGGVLAYVN